MNTVFSPVTNKAYFKYKGKLYNAPFNYETMNIDFEEVSLVDYFFLTEQEFADAMNTLSIMEEYHETN